MIKYPVVVVGSQYGDEGKGKVTDILAKDADYVVRYQGGNNAGHTVVVGTEVFKLHLLPSGVIYGKPSLIASGVVLDPRVVVQEVAKMKAMGKEVDIMIDPLTSIIMPYHNVMDGISETALKDNMIGTTKRGIGPAYADKYSRKGIRFVDLLDKDIFKKKLHENFILNKKIAEKVYGTDFGLDEDEIYKEYTNLAQQIKKYLGDVSKVVHDNIDSKKIVFESAQGTFLDITFGTYPYVTSSHPISGAVFTDVGFAPRRLDCVAIVKAYTTRVGSGPFLTELFDEDGKHMLDIGHEYGTTTGRPRRCGWLDLVMLKYSTRLNGFTSLAITKLDVLSGLKKVRVAVRYMIEGREVEFPLTIDQLEKCTVEYREFDGFTIDTNAKTLEELEPNARQYLRFMEDFLGVQISIVSIGPKRDETIIV
ncbi:MAG: adenylosuccinate synthase [Nanoarchaeota archaeon]|nr:adenylosuccinate synthase [Nanoarchaeota archaeon]